MASSAPMRTAANNVESGVLPGLHENDELGSEQTFAQAHLEHPTAEELLQRRQAQCRQRVEAAKARDHLFHGAFGSIMAPQQNHTGEEGDAMPVSLSIKNVPDPIARLLRQRAARHRRSLQGELLAILEESVTGTQTMSPNELVARVRAAGLETPAESALFVRADRDAR